MSLDNYTRLKVIGKGSYGEVWLARNKKDKKQYVLKKMDLKKASKRERKAAEQEAKLLSKLKHPNIVSYRDSFETDEGYLYISMQYCEGGDLYNKLKEQKGALLEERQVVEWFVQISMALQYMHERNILHRDLKTQNIFLTKSKIIKVGDLGIARVLDSSSDMATTLIGTPYYMSPELFSNKPYNHKSDVWALGCCVYEMTTLKHAFNAKDMNSLVYKILRGRMPAMPKQYSPDLLSLLKVMLQQDPEKRPSVNRVLRDPFIKKNITLFLEGTRQRHRTGSGTSARSISNRVASAGALAKSSESHSDTSSVKSVASASRVNLIGGGDCVMRNVGFGSRQSEDVDVPLAELEPISEHAHPTPDDLIDAEGNAKLTKDIHVRAEIRVPLNKADPTRDAVEHKGEGPSNNSMPLIKSSELPIGRRSKKAKDPDAESVKSLDSARSSKSSVMDRVGSVDGEDDDDIQMPKLSSRPRPLPPPPKVEADGGLPVRREELQRREERLKKPEDRSTDSSKSSGTSASSRDPEDGVDDLDSPTPRSLPNMSARERRRQNISTSQDKERPSSARRLKLVRPQSVKITRAEKHTNSPQEKVAAASNHGNKGHHRQPSLAEDSSSSSEEGTDLTEVPVGDRHKRRENKEMKNFILLLDTTLRLNKEEDKSDDERRTSPKQTAEEPVTESAEETSEQQSRRLSMPSAETLGNTGRLMERIRLLRKDCMHGVGYLKLRKAYGILERIEEDEVEPRLVELLGQDSFDLYAGKIWQLKFCEESAFGFKPS